MKVITTPQVVVSTEDVQKLLIRFIEKKMGKRVMNVDSPNAAGEFLVTLAPEETIFEEKNA